MEYVKPEEIEKRSMEIIDGMLAGQGIVLADETAHVVRRVIHTTADFDYAGNLVFTDGAAGHAGEALENGVIVTDTNMALAGINKAALKAHRCEAHCFMAEPFVAALAKQRETTRAVVATEYAAKRFPSAVFAVGNAPTALNRLCDLILEGVRPSLVIGVPVGFVNVVESKERALEICTQEGIPAIIALGRKGGSNTAAAICNALLYGKNRG